MTTSANQPSYISVKAAAAIGHVHVSTVRRWMHAKLFSWRRKNHDVFEVNEADFQKYLSQLTEPVGQSSP